MSRASIALTAGIWLLVAGLIGAFGWSGASIAVGVALIGAVLLSN